MGYISDIEWKGPGTFEEMDIWFCDPMKQLLQLFDEYYEEDNDEVLTFFYYEMIGKLNDLSDLLYRLMKEYREDPLPHKPQQAA